MENVIEYLIKKYKPNTFIVYGSYANGSSNEHSDFDALIIADVSTTFHDTSFVGDVQLDVFVYPASYFGDNIDASEVLQIHDGDIIIDEIGTGKKLKNQVNQYINSLPKKNKTENREQVEWCKKMLLRTERGDTEGYFRWHWLLCDSLQIYCDIFGIFYFGPKKAIKYMENTDSKGYALYTAALKGFEQKHLAAWIDYLSACCESLRE